MKKILGIILALGTLSSFASELFANGMTPNWSSAKKVQVGTSNTGTKSLVWFTNATGVLTETYYPTIDQAHIKDSQIIVSDGKNFFADEKGNTQHEVNNIHPSLVELNNKHTRFQISHTYYTASNKNILIDKITVHAFEDGLDFYLLVNPAINNSGFRDNGFYKNGYMSFNEDQTELNVRATVGFTDGHIGYVAQDDGHLVLRTQFNLNNQDHAKFNGNIAGTAKLNLPKKAGSYTFYITYEFNADSNISEEAASKYLSEYKADWEKYIYSLKRPNFSSKNQENLYDRSLYTLRVHEDKKNPGAMIASLSKPWGEELFEYPGVFTGGYHLIWPRDLFHVSLALIQVGDQTAARRSLRFLKQIQYKDGEWNYNNERIVPRRGAFPQNTWTTTEDYWGGYQIDQVGFPIQLFWHLYKRSNPTEKQKLLNEFGEMVKLAADFIYNNGPWSAQERWEENYGISPSSFSVATAALKVTSKIFGDRKYSDRANKWLFTPGDNIHTWTYTTSGPYDNGEHYVRVGGCEGFSASWNPNKDVECYIANSGQMVPMKAVLDQGFLKLVLHGLVPAGDQRIENSLAKVNKYIRKTMGPFSGWYRYSYDAYGEEKRGRLWPLLSSEHGRYAIAKYEAGVQSWKATLPKVNNILASYEFFANAGLMIPEQVFEHNGEGTGAATPLAWSHAEFLKLIWSKELKTNVENPLK